MGNSDKVRQHPVKGKNGVTKTEGGDIGLDN